MQRQSISLFLLLLLVSINLVKTYPVIPSKAEEIEAMEKRSSPHRNRPPRLLRSSTSVASSSSELYNREHVETLKRSLERSQSFQGVAQIGHALVGSFVVSQAMNMDLYHRRQRGATDLTLPSIDGANPFTGLNPLHAIAGAAVSQVITDPVGTYSILKDCVGSVCNTMTDLIKGKSSQSVPATTPESPRPLPTSPRVDGVTGWKKVKKYVGRRNRIDNSHLKRKMIKQKSTIHSS